MLTTIALIFSLRFCYFKVILKNSGDIDAVFSYVQSESLFGQQFEFTPTEGIIVPGGYQAIQVTIHQKDNVSSLQTSEHSYKMLYEIIQFLYIILLNVYLFDGVPGCMTVNVDFISENYLGKFLKTLTLTMCISLPHKIHVGQVYTLHVSDIKLLSMIEKV